MKSDHRSLFVRYIQHVTQCEGTNFICRIGDRGGGVKFTDEEVIELKALEKDDVRAGASEATSVAFTVKSLPSGIAVGGVISRARRALVCARPCRRRGAMQTMVTRKAALALRIFRQFLVRRVGAPCAIVGAVGRSRRAQDGGNHPGRQTIC
jgi:hypothetical protein